MPGSQLEIAGEQSRDQRSPAVISPELNRAALL